MEWLEGLLFIEYMGNCCWLFNKKKKKEKEEKNVEVNKLEEKKSQTIVQNSGNSEDYSKIDNLKGNERQSIRAVDPNLSGSAPNILSDSGANKEEGKFLDKPAPNSVLSASSLYQEPLSLTGSRIPENQKHTIVDDDLEAKWLYKTSEGLKFFDDSQRKMIEKEFLCGAGEVPIDFNGRRSVIIFKDNQIKGENENIEVVRNPLYTSKYGFIAEDNTIRPFPRILDEIAKEENKKMYLTVGPSRFEINTDRKKMKDLNLQTYREIKVLN
jgi:hypothetical protein